MACLHVDSIFLDAGGVLVWPNWTRVSHVLRTHRVEVSVARLAAADPPARFALDRPETIAVSTDQSRGPTYFELVLEHAGVSPSERTSAALEELQEYHQANNLWECVPDFVAPTLEQLRRAGHRLVVVSNSNGTLQRAFSRIGLAPLVDVMLDSAVEGVEKPERRFFELALTRSGARRETTVHVGDMYHVDVTGARAAGLSAVLVDERDLRPGADCPRIPSIASLPDLLADS
jgi:HAD superfamily hydrolase (TIGR01549 family)